MNNRTFEFTWWRDALSFNIIFVVDNYINCSLDSVCFLQCTRDKKSWWQYKFLERRMDTEKKDDDDDEEEEDEEV